MISHPLLHQQCVAPAGAEAGGQAEAGAGAELPPGLVAAVETIRSETWVILCLRTGIFASVVEADAAAAGAGAAEAETGAAEAEQGAALAETDAAGAYAGAAEAEICAAKADMDAAGADIDAAEAEAMTGSDTVPRLDSGVKTGTGTETMGMPDTPDMADMTDTRPHEEGTAAGVHKCTVHGMFKSLHVTSKRMVCDSGCGHSIMLHCVTC